MEGQIAPLRRKVAAPEIVKLNLELEARNICISVLVFSWLAAQDQLSQLVVSMLTSFSFIH